MDFTKKVIWHLALLVLAVALFTPKVLAAEKDTIVSLLELFERKPSPETANRFMDALLKERFIDQPVRFPPHTGVDSLCQQVYYWGGEWLYNQQQYEEARRLASKALPLFNPGNDARADCLNLLAIIYVRLGDFSNAANYAKQCLKMDMRSGDNDRISSSLNTIAAIYMAANRPKEAESHILRAIEHSERVDNLPRRAVILGTASEIYHKLGDDNKALAYARQAYSIDSLLKREPQASIRLSQKGYALLGLKRYKEAENVFRKVLPSLKNSGDRHSYAIVLNNMGRALLNQDRPSESIFFFNEAAGIFSSMGDLYNEIHSHKGLYESYWAINPDSAKIELDRFNMLKDSLYSHSSAEALSRYNAEFGNDKLRQENSDMRREHRRTIIFGIVLLIIVILASWLILRYTKRRIQRRMKKLMVEIEKLRDSADYNRTDAPSPQEESPATVADEPVSDSPDKQFLKSVIMAVNDAMANGNVSVGQIASELNMGEQSFRRRLQSAAGETPKAFFTAIRMEKASSLLSENPDMPVSRVAELCGFENVSSFGHSFKRMYDCSPSQFREKSLAK